MVDDDRKAAARHALRVWRTNDNNRDPLVIAADAVGMTQVEIAEESGLARNTVKSILTKHQGDTVNTTTTDPLTGLHHPHLINVESEVWGVRFDFAPFDGTEPRPEAPLEAARAAAGDDHSYVTLLAREYRDAEAAWLRGGYRTELRPLAITAAPAWEQWQATERAMNALYRSLTDTTGADKWRQMVLWLLNVQDAAVAAAEAWDAAAAPMARLYSTHRAQLGKLDRRLDADPPARVAAEFGIDAGAWHIAERTAYGEATYDDSPHTLRAEVLRVIEEQKARLREVAALSGDRAE